MLSTKRKRTNSETLDKPEKDVIYISPIKSRTYNTRGKKYKLDEDCEYHVRGSVELSNRFKLEVIDKKTNYKSREFNLGTRGHYFHNYDREGKIIGGYSILVDTFGKIHTIYFYERLGYCNYVNFWATNQYGHYFTKEDPTNVVKYTNINAVYDQFQNYYLGQHIIDCNRIICHGKGLIKYINGNTYIGNFFNNKKNGYGIYIVYMPQYNGLKIYDGYWVDNCIKKGFVFANDGSFKQINNV